MERTTKEPARSLAYINTHTFRVIVYICVPTNSMTTCSPASVLLLIYGYYDCLQLSTSSFFLIVHFITKSLIHFTKYFLTFPKPLVLPSNHHLLMYCLLIDWLFRRNAEVSEYQYGAWRCHVSPDGLDDSETRGHNRGYVRKTAFPPRPSQVCTE